jgi:hypothetical protein
LNTPGPICTTQFVRESPGRSYLEWGSGEEFLASNSQIHTSTADVVPSPVDAGQQLGNINTELSIRREPLNTQSAAISTPCSTSTRVLSPHSTTLGAAESLGTNYDYCSNVGDRETFNQEGECKLDKEECIVAPQKVMPTI